MKPFPLPVVAFVGAGSQPEDPDLAYMPLPVQMDSFTMPALPSSEDIRHLNTALAVVGELAELAARWTPVAGSLSRSLAGLPKADLTLVNQVLGEGEVSARALLADGGEVRIQESVFAGVWRVCTFNAAGEQTGDAVEIAPVPSVLIERAQASSRWLDSLPALPPTLMNAAPIGAELLARQRYGSGLIDFRTVLETKRTLLNTQDGVESTRASLSADHVRLYKALGGGWTPETEPSAP